MKRRFVLAGVLAWGAMGCDPHEDRGRSLTGGQLPSAEYDDEEDDTDWEEDETGDASLDEVSAFILGLGHLWIPDLVPKTQAPCLGLNCPEDGQEGDEWCSYVHYNETAHAHDLIAFQPNSATLWPGNIVQGGDAKHGLLTPIGLPRAPMIFSVSLENLLGSPVGHMDTPSLSAFREQRNAILAAGTDGAVPAQMAYKMQRVHHESQVAVALGGSVNWFGGSLSSLFEFGNVHTSTKMLVDFTQAYYTIDVDTPGMPSDLFTDDVTVNQLETFMQVENPPMYVQSITYGRRVIFSVESSYSEHEVRFAFDASLNAFLVGGGVEIDTYYREVLEQSKISAIVIGGSGADAVKTVLGYEGLLDYIADGADYSKDSPGAPIAYKLAYLDNSGVKLAHTSEYSERQCYSNFMDVTGEVARLETPGGSANVFGWLDFRVAPPNDPDPCRNDAPGWQRIFDRGRGGAQSVHGLWVPQTPIRKTEYDFEVFEDANMCIRGHLRDKVSCWFFCNDKDFGTASLGPIPLSAGWAGDHALEFSNQGTVIATVRISVD